MAYAVLQIDPASFDDIADRLKAVDEKIKPGSTEYQSHYIRTDHGGEKHIVFGPVGLEADPGIVIGKHGYVLYGPDGEYHWTANEPEPHPEVDEVRPATGLEKGLLESLGGSTEPFQRTPGAMSMAKKIACWDMIERLRSYEGDDVRILCDNPDGLNAIECSGAWTDYATTRIDGVNTYQCLVTATAMHNDYYHDKDPELTAPVKAKHNG